MTSPAITQELPVTQSTPTVQGRFVWHELLVGNVDAAAAFYPAVTGWSVQTMTIPGAERPYTMFARGETALAGVTSAPPQLATPGNPFWLPYIGTESVDATCRDALALGARQLMAPADIPTVGRAAVLRDPQGAAFALFTPGKEARPEREAQVGEFAWHEMMCDDPEASLGFYIRLFGWTKTRAMDMGADGVYQMYGRGELTYGGFGRRSKEMPPAFWNSYVRVADLDASIEAVKRNGGKIVMGPIPVPMDDRVVIVADNQNAVVSLVGKVKP